MDYVIHPEQVEAWPIKESVEARVVGLGQSMTGLMSTWAPGSELGAHVHPHEQIGICLQGRSIFTIDGRKYAVQKGDVYHIPSNVPHGERNVGDEPVVFFECFAPIREDLMRRQFGARIVGEES